MSRIMIFAEAVTLAHVARPIALSRILRELGHDVCIAAAPPADRWLAGEAVARERIDSIAAATFLHALARGIPAYDLPTLVRYVADDVRAIAAWGPDIVLGDFRLSLYVSSKLSGKPYGAIANAYWSRRYWQRGVSPPMPPFTWLPRPVASALFSMIRPAAFALHALPFHRACRNFGVRSPGLDLRDVYTASDATAFADVAALYAPRGAITPSTDAHFVGPLAWAPADGAIPASTDRAPRVFVSLGSSGMRDAFADVLEVIATLPVRCIVAGAVPASALPANCVYAAEVVAYDAACREAAVVVCNGGAPATYAALAHGARVIGIASNLDQVLNLAALRRWDAEAVAFDARRLDRHRLRQALENLLAKPSRKHPPTADDRTPIARVADWIAALGTLRPAVEAVYKRAAQNGHPVRPVDSTH
jgi:UDP:flavonoid glycosyltransferase YjiC (YdhE family)